ncbi:MAG: 16S rRNA (cytosine(1402)-N(4))-methyltransferase RsmH [bacterium]
MAADNLDAATTEHVPVLLNEVLKTLLAPGVDLHGARFVDATFGRGGHSRALLAQLPADARLLVIDRDPEAIAVARQLAQTDPRVCVCHARFSDLATVLEQQGFVSVQGILLDLGVSSPQLDEGARGFSFRHDGPLDMRMDSSSGETAAQWLNRAEEQEIVTVLRNYGEERFAGRIARAIIQARPLQTTQALADTVAQAVPQRGPVKKHPATQTFQAVRVHVNQEFIELEAGLAAAFSRLAGGGRLAVISFHSLEDRVVKHTFRSWTRPPALPRRVPLRHTQMPTAATDIAGPVRAGALELKRNPRARSATLRVIEKKAQHV